MKILLFCSGVIPAKLYGGIERVVWCLGRELVKAGHEVTFMAKPGSKCDFAKVIVTDPDRDIIEQIPSSVDIVHFHGDPVKTDSLQKPYLFTWHGNGGYGIPLDKNTVFISANHAERYGSGCFVYNGLDWSEYADPDLSSCRKWFHFLGKACWRVKNVSGAIAIIKRLRGETLRVIGGRRFNIKMGVRFTFNHRIKFHGMLGGADKDSILNGSKGLIFPVRWHEPFGLAIVESLYFGCPVFGTPYGSLPELVPGDVGYLSNSATELVEALKNHGSFSKRRCHEFAAETFNSKKMADSYLEKYHTVLCGKPLNGSAPSLREKTGRFLEWNS